MPNRLCTLLCLLLITAAATAQSLPGQNGDSTAITDGRLVASYVNSINAKTSRITQQLDKHTSKTLAKVQKQEAAIKRKLQQRDSTKAAAIFGNAEEQYKKLEQRLDNVNSIQQYIPAYDTALTALKFLQQHQQLAAIAKQTGNIKQSLQKINELGTKLEKAEEVKKFLKERKQYLKDQLQNLGFAKQLKKLNKQAYYYGEQLNEYKSLLKDHKKAERKAIELLSKTKLFQNFMRKNSMLASLFRLPGDPNDPSTFGGSLAGLQTRAQVNSLIQQQIGTNGQAQLQQNMRDAQSQLQHLKEKVIKAGKSNSGELWDESSSGEENFRPNEQKTKSFLKRLEYGTNFQSQKASNFFPITSDIGLSVGYKITSKSIIGIGASYKVGWGNSWKNINVTNQGIGLRSFMDWKIKGSFWLTGGYEQNYKNVFRDIDELKNRSAWQQSGLLGLSKIVSMKTKLLKKTKLQLLWDFLSYRQAPQTQALLFRIGYGL